MVTCALALSGCSALSGHDVKVAPITTASSTAPTTSTAAKPAAAAVAQLNHADTVTAVLKAAKQDFETLFTYDYRNLDRYRTAGLKVTAEPYSTKYGKGLSGATAAEVRQLQQVQVPTARHAGIVSLTDHETAAVVIVNGSLVTSSADTPAPTTKATTVGLHLKLVGRAWRVSNLVEGGKVLGTVPANHELDTVLQTTRGCIDRIFGLSRARFDADFAGVLGCTTGELHGHLQLSRASQRKTLTDGEYDLSSKIVGLGVAATTGNSVEILVVLDEYRLARQGSKSGPYPLVFDVIALRANGKWLLSAAAQVS